MEKVNKLASWTRHSAQMYCAAATKVDPGGCLYPVLWVQGEYAYQADRLATEPSYATTVE